MLNEVKIRKLYTTLLQFYDEWLNCENSVNDNIAQVITNYMVILEVNQPSWFAISKFLTHLEHVEHQKKALKWLIRENQRALKKLSKEDFEQLSDWGGEHAKKNKLDTSIKRAVNLQKKTKR